ncbi:MAG: DNA mismatch endonuclease Vsr [Phycisphaerales bacterium]|nr:DNA mismatch endonuclease Vsr [Phycisphaerales bacterium]
MTDRLTEAQRSKNMSRIRSKDTGPEMVVRRLVHAMGFRYRLHVRSLPGKPDLVFPAKHKAVLVHGCFWHSHRCKEGRRSPKSRVEYWGPKIARNADRDRQNQRRLRALGWSVLVVWECETLPSRLRRLSERLRRFLIQP